MKKAACAAAFMCLLCCLTGCGADDTSGNVADIGTKEETTESILQQTEGAENIVQTESQTKKPYTIDTKTDEEIACAGINALEDFIMEIGLPATLRELGVDENMDLKAIADSCAIVPGSYKKLTKEEILGIFRECY